MRTHQRLEYLYSPPKKVLTNASASIGCPLAVLIRVLSSRYWVVLCDRQQEKLGS